MDLDPDFKKYGSKTLQQTILSFNIKPAQTDQTLKTKTT
jgi:hypothetical protein